MFCPCANTTNIESESTPLNDVKNSEGEVSLALSGTGKSSALFSNGVLHSLHKKKKIQNISTSGASGYAGVSYVHSLFHEQVDETHFEKFNENIDSYISLNLFKPRRKGKFDCCQSFYDCLRFCVDVAFYLGILLIWAFLVLVTLVPPFFPIGYSLDFFVHSSFNGSLINSTTQGNLSHSETTGKIINILLVSTSIFSGVFFVVHLFFKYACVHFTKKCHKTVENFKKGDNIFNSQFCDIYPIYLCLTNVSYFFSIFGAMVLFFLFDLFVTSNFLYPSFKYAANVAVSATLAFILKLGKSYTSVMVSFPLLITVYTLPMDKFINEKYLFYGPFPLSMLTLMALHPFLHHFRDNLFNKFHKFNLQKSFFMKKDDNYCNRVWNSFWSLFCDGKFTFMKITKSKKELPKLIFNTKSNLWRLRGTKSKDHDLVSLISSDNGVEAIR
jgi:hypothetical protein